MVTAKVKAVGNAERDEWPDLSDDERDRRWREVRWRMDMAGLDCLLVWGNESKWQSALANNRYLTGRVAPGCVLFPLDGEPVIWSGFPHDVTKWGALAGGWVEDVRSGQSTTDNIIETLRDRQFANAAIGVVGFGETRPRVIPETVPYQQFSRITSALEGARFVDAGWLIEQARIIKGPEEIACIRKVRRAGQSHGRRVDRLGAARRPRDRSVRRYAARQPQPRRRGGHDLDQFGGRTAAPRQAPAGEPSRPGGWRHRRLRIPRLLQGYLTGAEMSVSLGEPKAEYQRIHEVCVETQTSGIAAMKPGNFIEDAVHAFRQPIIDAGFGSVECGFHGHGLASPEFPSCMYGGTAGSWQKHAYARIPAIEFQENMVFATASDIYDPGWNKDTGLMMGRTVVITDKGPEEITGIPLEPEMIAV